MLRYGNAAEELLRASEALAKAHADCERVRRGVRNDLLDTICFNLRPCGLVGELTPSLEITRPGQTAAGHPDVTLTDVEAVALRDFLNKHFPAETKTKG